MIQNAMAMGHSTVKTSHKVTLSLRSLVKMCLLSGNTVNDLTQSPPIYMHIIKTVCLGITRSKDANTVHENNSR